MLGRVEGRRRGPRRRSRCAATGSTAASAASHLRDPSPRSGANASLRSAAGSGLRGVASAVGGFRREEDRIGASQRGGWAPRCALDRARPGLEQCRVHHSTASGSRIVGVHSPRGAAGRVNPLQGRPSGHRCLLPLAAARSVRRPWDGTKPHPLWLPQRVSADRLLASLSRSPDPKGWSLALIRKVLKAWVPTRIDKAARFGVFWDFPSLFQHPEGGKRTPEEDALFKQV